MKPLTPDEDLRGGDEADRADVQSQQNLAIAIRQAQATPVLRATGLCHWCQDAVPAGLRFCVPEPMDPVEWSCIREYERSKKAQVRNLRVPEPEDLFEDPQQVLEQIRRDGLI
jgi:hypothetical protein